MRVLGDIAVKQGRLLRDRTALIDTTTDRAYSFADLAERAARVANGLIALGVRPGDRVAMMLGNCVACAELPFGVTLAGGIMVNVNEKLTQDEVAYILEDSGASIIVTSSSLLEIVESARKRLADLRQVITVDSADGTVDYESMLAGVTAELPPVAVTPEDTAMLIYTSGTTGRPKGVQLTHGNIVASAANWLIECYVDPRGVYLAVAPYYHVACVSHLAALMRGMTVIPTPFDPVGNLTLIDRYRVTHTLLVPTMIGLLLDQATQLDSLDLSSLQGVYYAGAPIPEPLLRRALERWGPIFIQMYGLTESASISTILRREEHSLGEGRERLASIGREITLTEVRIGTIDGEVPIGERGEILIRGANVTPGYWNRPEASAESLKDGWLHTGDIGLRDEDGFVYIVDRKNDIVIVGGTNVYPREVETVLYAHPAIAEAAVIGIPHETWGETLVAVVARAAGRALSEAEVIDFCAQRLAKFKTPRQVVFVDTLPKTPIGKIDKASLRKQETALQRVTAPRSQ